MFKKSLIVVAAVAAMALPAAALGDGGTPPGPGAKLAQAQDKLNHLKKKCDAKPEAAAKCAKLAAGLLARLDKLSARIDALESKISKKCSVATPPTKCSKAANRLARLDAAKQDIAQLEASVKANFQAPATA